jgi:hypothetical protein
MPNGMRSRMGSINTQSAPTQPSSATLLWVNVSEPKVAPMEKPRYIKEAFNERMIGDAGECHASAKARSDECTERYAQREPINRCVTKSLVR